MAVREAIVAAVASSCLKGTPRDPVERGRLKRDHGLEGDAHAGPGPRQVSILSLPGIRGIEAGFGAPLDLGRFDQNLLLDGDLPDMAIGDLLAIGGRAVLEVTSLGKEGHPGIAIRQQTGDCIMPRDVVFARVVAGGDVAPGDRARWLRPSVDLAAAVLAGGRSTRFLADKRRAMLDGRTLLERALATAREVSPTVYLSLGAGESAIRKSGAVPIMVDVKSGTVPVFDDVVEAGPLAGITAVLRGATGRYVAFLPVDMPGVTPDLLRVLAALCRGPGLAFREGGHLHPLPACYDRAALPALESAIVEGGRSLRAAAASAGATFLDASAVEELGDPARQFRNVNTPEDLEAWVAGDGQQAGESVT